MLSKKNIVSFWVLLLICFCSNLLARENIKGVTKILSGIGSFQGKFEQVYFDALLNRSQKSSGEVKYLKPGMMVWEYAAPEALKIVIGKEKIWIYDPLLENVTVQSIDAVTRVEVLSFFIQEKQVDDHYRVIQPVKKFIKEAVHKEVYYLEPISPKTSFKEIQLQVDTRNNAITKFAILEHNGNYRIVSLSEIIFNEISDESQFTFQIPEGVEVISGDE